VSLGLPPTPVTFCLPTFVFIPFVMMRNKDNSYISNLSPSTGGPSWILAICALRIMKTSLGMGTSSSSEFDSRSSWSF
jgi:hypothetical protein